jgi:hypothetical protein
MMEMAARAESAFTAAIFTVPSSSMSIFTPVCSWIPRMTFPPGPMISRILSVFTIIT